MQTEDISHTRERLQISFNNLLDFLIDLNGYKYK